MENTFSEYMQIIVGAILFTSAISFMLLLLGLLNKYNGNQIESTKTRASVYMEDNTHYQDEVIYITGSEVFTDILSQKSNIPLFINGSKVDENYLLKAKEDDKDSLKYIRDKISLNDTYLVKIIYSNDNDIEKIEYNR